jgi:cold shock CspA family protein
MTAPEVVALGIADLYHRPRVSRDPRPVSNALKQALTLRVNDLNRGARATRYAVAEVHHDGSYRALGVVAEPADWEPLAVKWFNPILGYGFFLSGPGKPDIFVHASTLQACGVDPEDLEPGRIAHVRYGETERGLSAVQVQIYE